jgi:hypothetical protein
MKMPLRGGAFFRKQVHRSIMQSDYAAKLASWRIGIFDNNMLYGKESTRMSGFEVLT